MEHLYLPQTLTGKGVALLATLITVIALFGLYNVFLHPLRMYPGPLLWRAYRLPYVISVFSGDIHGRMRQFHDKYGPAVRIAPNELSYTSATAWKDIYSTRPGHATIERNRTWFVRRPGEAQSIMSFDEDAHSRARRTFSNSTSEKSLKEQTPVIERYVSDFISALGIRAGEVVDMKEWYDYLTFDISGDLSFGESFDCIKTGRPHPWVDIANGFGKGLVLISSINLYPPLNKLLRYILPKSVMQKQIDHRAMSTAKAKQRLALDEERPDFITPAKKYADAKDSLTEAEWMVNMSIIVFAASETTSSALSAITRCLVQSQAAHERVAQEVRSTFASEDDITIGSTATLPYLNAVIQEGLRMGPPAAIGVPRVIPEGGETLCGRWLPEGTYVAANQFPTNRDARNFHEPDAFKPERWLDKNSSDDVAAFQPFALGRHSCIGMKLAYAEMRLVLCRLLYAFDLALADESDMWDWGEQKTFIFWDKKPLQIILRSRQND